MKNSFAIQQIQQLPIIAILRGVTPTDILDIGQALYEAGIKAMEVTLNSPDPIESIKILTSELHGKMAIGAGTVTTPEQVKTVYETGGEFIVSPNTDQQVISQTAELGMYSLPGVATCTECFQAIKSGASALKIFPASVVGVEGIKNLKAVIPREIEMFAVGGVNEKNMGDWLRAGAFGVGLGSNIYAAGDTPEETFRKAQIMIEAYKQSAGPQKI